MLGLLNNTSHIMSHVYLFADNNSGKWKPLLSKTCSKVATKSGEKQVEAVIGRCYLK